MPEEKTNIPDLRRQPGEILDFMEFDHAVIYLFQWAVDFTEAHARTYWKPDDPAWTELIEAQWIIKKLIEKRKSKGH